MADRRSDQLTFGRSSFRARVNRLEPADVPRGEELRGKVIAHTCDGGFLVPPAVASAIRRHLEELEREIIDGTPEHDGTPIGLLR